MHRGRPIVAIVLSIALLTAFGSGLDELVTRALAVSGKAHVEQLALAVERETSPPGPEVRGLPTGAYPGIAPPERGRATGLVPGLQATPHDPVAEGEALSSEEPARGGASRPAPVQADQGDTDAARDLDLIHAAKHGDLARAEKRLAEGARVDATDSEFEATALHWAAYYGHDALVSLLLSKGADVNALNREGRTPLMFACGMGHQRVVIILLTKGAATRIRDNDGRTALDWALGKGHEDVAALLGGRP